MLGITFKKKPADDAQDTSSTRNMSEEEKTKRLKQFLKLSRKTKFKVIAHPDKDQEQGKAPQAEANNQLLAQEKAHQKRREINRYRRKMKEKKLMQMRKLDKIAALRGLAPRENTPVVNKNRVPNLALAMAASGKGSAR